MSFLTLISSLGNIMDGVDIEDLTIEQYLELTQNHAHSVALSKYTRENEEQGDQGLGDWFEAELEKCYKIQQTMDNSHLNLRRQARDDALRNWEAQIDQIRRQEHEVIDIFHINAIADLGAIVNIMSESILEELSLIDPKNANIIVEMAHKTRNFVKKKSIKKAFQDMLHGLGEVNPTHAYYHGSRTSKDNEDPCWSTSFKTRRTQKTSSALEDFIHVVFVLVKNIHERLSSNMGDVDINILTMKQYLALTQGNQAPGVVKPNVNFEIKSQFTRELCEDTFLGNKNDDAHEHVERVLDIERSTLGIYSRKLSSKGCGIYGGPHLDKECPLNEEVKGIKEVKYGEFRRYFPNNGGNGAWYRTGPSGYYKRS
ncbi:hypothetical protein Tco_0669251 [Tanacetum coccineum]